MTREFERRGVLKALGAVSVSGLAGCSSSQDKTSPETTETTDEVQGNGSPEDDSMTETSGGELEMVEEITGHIKVATSISDTLTYVTGGGSQRVVHGDSKGPAFDYVFDQFLASVNGGVAYEARDHETDVLHSYIMSGGDELNHAEFQKSDLDISMNDGPRTRRTGLLWDTFNGEPIWTEPSEERYPPSFMVGNERVDTEFDGVDQIQVIGDEVAFSGHRYIESEDRWDVEAVVVGDDIVQEINYEDEGIRGYGRLEGIDGNPAFVLDKGDGEFIQYGDQQIGGEYTTVQDGGFLWIGEIDGSLAFVAMVARDKIESQERHTEDALWYDGDEIDRRTDIAGISRQIAMTDDGLAYSFSDTDEVGVVVGDTVRVLEISPAWVRSIDGDLAYNIQTEDGEAVVYRDQQTEYHPSIEAVFELDGDLAYLAQTEENKPRSNAIYREA